MEANYAAAVNQEPVKPKKAHRGPHIYRETKEDAGDGLVYWVAQDDKTIKIAAKPYRYQQ